MPKISVIICSLNPRTAYLDRTLRSLQAQTVNAADWELLLVDNNSREPLSARWDLSWHPNGRHVLEPQPGLTSARIRGINEARGDLLVFVDDDNVLAPDYLERALSIRAEYPQVPVFGAGVLEPEFEIVPPPRLTPWLSMLALRTVATPQWANDRAEAQCRPWGAGLCVSRGIAAVYVGWMRHLNVSTLDRVGERLFCGGDDLFSFVACHEGGSFGVFPELRITHLISSARLTEAYILRLNHDHAYSHAIMNHLLFGEIQPRRHWLDRARTLLHGVRRGWFSMRCRVAATRGQAAAAEFIRAEGLQPAKPEQLRVNATSRDGQTNIAVLR